MAIPNYLANIKCAGVYRYVFDKSEIPASERNSLRLVVGYSERGPFNTPVYISDAAEFIQTFGNISRRMERKGVFFHRLAIQALEAGPILALNLKPFKNETAKMISFNASDLDFSESVDLNLSADSIELTCEVPTGADYTALDKRCFYKPVPDYKKDEDGKFVFVGSKSGEARYIRTIEGGKEYFWTSTEFIYKTGNPNFIEGFKYDLVLFNNEYLKPTKVDGKDDVYKANIGQKHGDTLVDDALVALDGTNVAKEHWTTIYDTNRFWKITDDLMSISPVTGASKRDYMRIVQTSSKEDSVTIFMRPVVPAGYNIKISDWYASETSDEMPAYMESIKDHYLSEFFMEIFVFKGDLAKEELFKESGTLGSHVNDKWVPFCEVKEDTVYTNPNYLNAFGSPGDALASMADVTTSGFIGSYQGIMFPSFRDTNGSFISIDSIFNSDYAAHKCLMAIDESILDEAYEADLDYNGEYTNGEADNTFVPDANSIAGLIHKLTSCVHAVKTGESGASYEDYNDVDSIPTNTKVYGYYLEGYNYNTIAKNESGVSLVEDKIYSVLGYKGIREALTNNVDVDYKYLVDTFQGYPGLSMKSALSSVVKDKFNALAILNFPPMSDVAVFCGYPGLTGGFDMSKVTRRSSGISLPAEVQGASWAAFYTQLQMTDGTNKFVVPSAALVSNLFMQKWSTRLPYYIVAGPNHGRIVYPGVIGPDYNFATNDRKFLEPFGVNCMTYIPRKGTVINGNQTAKQTPKTALSKVHVRELVTFLQDTIEDMLYGYQWELNTATLRDAVSAKCETILGLIAANGGIYDYRVQCDDQNNTPEIIDNEMLIVDVEIEPARGSEKMVQTLTIHRTGGIAATPRS